VTGVIYRKLHRQLDLLNINESTVFPYIENSARYAGIAGLFDAHAKVDAAQVQQRREPATA
jgi:hypothetical protein